jgi:uncharacterized membrane protein YqjE
MTADNTHNGLRDEPLGELFKQLSDDVSALVRQELRLAQAEMTEKGKKAGVGAGLIGAAGLVGVLALGAFTTCLIAALVTGMDVWIAALIVTAVYATVAAALALFGKSRVVEASPPKPEQTIETVKEDVQWAKTQLPSEKR